MLTVRCVKWGQKYGPEWVVRLRNMVAVHLPVEHEFVCHTDAPVDGVKCEPLPSDLPSWWAKLGLFRLTGENLYFDLDVVIRGDLTKFLKPGTGKLWALDDFSYSLVRPKMGLDPASIKLLGGSGTCNSSIMYWEGDAPLKAWDSFTRDVMDRLHGDQNWITQVLWPHSLALYEPGLACSYKYHVQRDDDHGAVVVFHGDPKVCDLPPRNELRVRWEAA